MQFNLCNKDCLEALKELSEDTVDSLVTDPPAGIGFMGKEWDGDKGGREGWIAWLTEVMCECYRVLKPGAHGLVWAIPRTSHWTATALENAGFEIRDIVTHLFGTGFPKSLDISKAIDKAAGAEREVIGEKPFASSFGQGKREGTTVHPGGWVEAKRDLNVTAPATDAARQWQGWGTALKPASEHWVLVRKPLGEKTVAANVLKHGTGGINIDGCRLQTQAKPTPSGIDRYNQGFVRDGANRKPIAATTPAPTGRFPANLVLSHNDDCEDMCTPGCAVAMLDEQSGISTSTGGKNMERVNAGGLGDTGGASRFFYCAKASKSDRGEGNTHPTVKSTRLMGYLVRMVTPAGGTVLDPFMGSGSTGVSALREGFKFAGIEKDINYYNIAKLRLKKVVDDKDHEVC